MNRETPVYPSVEFRRTTPEAGLDAVFCRTLLDGKEHATWQPIKDSVEQAKLDAKALMDATYAAQHAGTGACDGCRGLKVKAVE